METRSSEKNSDIIFAWSVFAAFVTSMIPDRGKIDMTRSSTAEITKFLQSGGISSDTFEFDLVDGVTLKVTTEMFPTKVDVK